MRFEDCSSNATRLKYVTDGMLLREAMVDPLLQRYNLVVLDEAHERTVHTDVLCALMKSIVQRRQHAAIASSDASDTDSHRKRVRPLRLVIMSATLDSKAMAEYFELPADRPPLYIAGRMYPIDVLYADQPVKDYVEAAVVTVLQIHQTAPLPGDILLFLTGQEEIEAVERLLLQANEKSVVGTRSLDQS